MPIQVRFQTEAEKAAEHKRANSKNAMMPGELVRGIGVVSGTSTGGTRNPRISGSASKCVSYKLDEYGNKVDARLFAAGNTGTRANSRSRRKSASRAELDAFRAEMAANLAAHKVTARDLPAILAD